MQKLLLLLAVIILAQYEVTSQSIIELDPKSNMSITGKGPGQDAAINPYLGTDCFGIVKNIGKNNFVIRIQKDGKILEQISVKPKENKKIVLLKGYELYLDSTLKAKAKVVFSKKTDCV